MLSDIQCKNSTMLSIVVALFAITQPPFDLMIGDADVQSDLLAVQNR